MRNRVMYMTALAVCTLGMAACSGGKQDGMSAQGQAAAEGSGGQAQAGDGNGQGRTEGQQDTESGKQQQGAGKGEPGSGEEGTQDGQSLGAPGDGKPDGSMADSTADAAGGSTAGSAADAAGGSVAGSEANAADGSVADGNTADSTSGSAANTADGSTSENTEGSMADNTGDGLAGSMEKGTEGRPGGTEENTGNPAGGDAKSPAGGPGSDVDGNLYVRMDEAAEEYKAEDGTVLLTVEKVLPVVVISDNEKAADKINTYIREKGFFGEESLLFDMSEKDTLEMAELRYEEGGGDSWVGEYSLSAGYIVTRMDERVISFDAGAYYFLGGAHPNTIEAGITFDTQTGKRLMLADVVKDKEEAAAAVKEFLLAETGKEEYQGVLFGDYETYLDDLFSETTWYLGEDGFHIIANTYSIAPYVAGSFDFVIPYGQADFLKEEYR